MAVCQKSWGGSWIGNEWCIIRDYIWEVSAASPCVRPLGSERSESLRARIFCLLVFLSETIFYNICKIKPELRGTQGNSGELKGT